MGAGGWGEGFLHKSIFSQHIQSSYSFIIYSEGHSGNNKQVFSAIKLFANQCREKSLHKSTVYHSIIKKRFLFYYSVRQL